MEAIKEIARDSLSFMGFMFISIAIGPVLFGGDAVLQVPPWAPWSPVAIVGLVAAHYAMRRCILGLAAKRSTGTDEALTRFERTMRVAWPEAVSAGLIVGCVFGLLAIFGATIPPV